MGPANKEEWLLVFYSVPSQPVSNRMKIWRKLAKTGAVQLKGAVYVLPASEEHREFFQWLISEVTSMGGDGAFARSSAIEPMDDAEIKKLFTGQRDREYRELEKNLEPLERKIESIRKGTRQQDRRVLADMLGRIVREFDDVKKRDFFSSERGREMTKRIQQAQTAMNSLGKSGAGSPPLLKSKQPDQYRGREWVTRTRPFVDRMASAWLIRKLIDPSAAFRFIREEDLKSVPSGSVVFDMKGGEFTHHGDLCTFEVLVKTFSIRDKAVRSIAEIVHDLDIKDDKYEHAETAGVEDILTGIRKSATDDGDALERGMAVFELLYQSRTS